MSKSKSAYALTARRIDAGKLIGLEYADEIWILTFENKLTIECYGGWRIMLSGRNRTTVMGSRDLRNAVNPIAEVSKELGEYEAKTISFTATALADSTEISFLHKSNDLRSEYKIFELLKNSVETENWKIIGEDFVDTDKIGLIKNL